MKLSDRVSVGLAFGVSAGTAIAARRLLTPNEQLPTPDAVDAAQYFTAEEIRAGKRYARPQLMLGVARSAVEVGTLAALVSRRSRRQPASVGRLRRAPATDATTAALAGIALTTGLTVAKLPVNALSRRRALSVGLSTQNWRSWGEDIVKSTAIEATLSGALLAGSSALASRWPRTWWLPAAGGVVATGALAGMLAPVLTDPLFNRFDALADGETRSDVLGLATAAGVKVGEVYSVDASKRTTAVNAYVNGLGPTKRVVLFDTLLADYSRDEVRFVVAHELGHVRYRDVPRQIAFLALSAPAAAFAAQRLTMIWAGQLTGAAAVPALSLSLWLVGAPLGISGAALSRAVERRTDDFGLHLSDAPEALISFFRRIALQNHADVSAPRFLGKLLATHPPITERIGAALAYQRITAGVGAGSTGQP